MLLNNLKASDVVTFEFSNDAKTDITCFALHDKNV